MAALPQTRNAGRATMFWEENARVFASPVSGSEQRLNVWGRWQMRLDYERLEPDEYLALLSFTEDKALDEAFTAMHPTQRAPQPLWAWADGAVKGVVAGKTATTDGWADGGSPLLILKDGDLVRFADIDQVVRVKADVTTDGAGNATLTFAQTLRSSPTDNTAVEVEDVTFTMVLTRNPQAQYVPPELASFSLEMREDV